MKIISIASALLLLSMGIYSQNGVPQSIINSLNLIDDTTSLPEPEFINKKTSLKIQVLDYNSEKNLDVLIEPNMHLFFGGDGQINGCIASDGTFEAEFNLQIPQNITCIVGEYVLRVFLSPDKESMVYLDLDKYSQDGNTRYAFFGGENAEINNQMYSPEMMALNRKSYYNSESVKGMSKEQFKDYMLEGMHQKIADIQKLINLSKKTLEFATADTKINTAMFMLEPNLLTLSREEQSDEPAIDLSYCTYLKSFDLNNKKYAYHPFYSALCGNLFSQIRSDMISSLEQVKKCIGHEDGYAIDMLKARIIANILTGIEPIEEEFLLKMMSSIKEPHYSEYLTDRNNKLKKSFKTAVHTNNIEIEKNDDAISIDQILAQNKGKVIFIDFWATWCSPCMADIRKSKSRKSKYTEKEVQFIYLTNESSPMKNWNNMKENIPGKHYRFSEKKMGEIFKTYKFNSYPSYLIFNKAGELIYQTTEPTNIISLMDIIEDELKKQN